MTSEDAPRVSPPRRAKCITCGRPYARIDRTPLPGSERRIVKTYAARVAVRQRKAVQNAAQRSRKRKADEEASAQLKQALDTQKWLSSLPQKQEPN
jgi:hypothetical protein